MEFWIYPHIKIVEIVEYSTIYETHRVPPIFANFPIRGTNSLRHNIIHAHARTDKLLVCQNSPLTHSSTTTL